jgi:hypothetical protein
MEPLGNLVPSDSVNERITFRFIDTTDSQCGRGSIVREKTTWTGLHDRKVSRIHQRYQSRIIAKDLQGASAATPSENCPITSSCKDLVQTTLLDGLRGSSPLSTLV